MKIYDTSQERVFRVLGIGAVLAVAVLLMGQSAVTHA